MNSLAEIDCTNWQFSFCVDRNVHIGVIVASGAAIFCGLCKAYHGTYLPPTFKSPVSNRRKDRLA